MLAHFAENDSLQTSEVIKDMIMNMWCHDIALSVSNAAIYLGTHRTTVKNFGWGFRSPSRQATNISSGFS